ncbi:hypothetical protein V6N13_051140 [Hibiscus sabdariffa]
MSNNSFTWFRGGSHVTVCKSNRFLISLELLSYVPNLVQTTYPWKLSDHAHVLAKEVSKTGGPRPFKRFSHWVNDPQFNNMVGTTLSSNHRRGLGSKLRAVKSVVKSWVTEARSKDTETIELLGKKT